MIQAVRQIRVDYQLKPSLELDICIMNVNSELEIKVTLEENKQ